MLAFDSEIFFPFCSMESNDIVAVDLLPELAINVLQHHNFLHRME
jgi:hypothetical protein